jgi:hypothetical protein
MRTYTARRIELHFFECVNEDGGPAEVCDDDTFNVNMVPWRTEDDYVTFDTMRELIDAVRRDCVTFDSTGAEWASDPDGSHIIDYATGERCTVSWHFDEISPRLLERVIIPAVDA